MKVKSLLWSALCMLAFTVTFSSCDNDDDSWDDNGSTVELPQHRAFILNEGSYEGNNAGIAFYAPNKDSKDNKNNFISNIYLKQNGKNLGDTGQDIIEYEDKIYVIVYTSRILLRLNAAGVEEARLSFTEADGNPRYMAAKDGKIYVTLYSGKIARINANTLQIEDYVSVGSNPEQIVEEGGKIYVANSAWGDGTTVSIVDIATFTKEKDIEVGLNPNLLLEANDEIYLISWGKSWVSPAVPYAFQRIKYDGTCENITVATHFAKHNDIIYLANSNIVDWENYTGENSFFTYNAKSHQLNTNSFLNSMPQELGTKGVRGINVDDKTGDIYIYTYGKGVTNGDVYRFKSNGTFVEMFDCGGINPSKIIFL